VVISGVPGDIGKPNGAYFVGNLGGVMVKSNIVFLIGGVSPRYGLQIGGLAKSILLASVNFGLLILLRSIEGEAIFLSEKGVIRATGEDNLSGVTSCESEFGPFDAFTLRFRLPEIFPGHGRKDGNMRFESELRPDIGVIELVNSDFFRIKRIVLESGLFKTHLL